VVPLLGSHPSSNKTEKLEIPKLTSVVLLKVLQSCVGLA